MAPGWCRGAQGFQRRHLRGVWSSGTGRGARGVSNGGHLEEGAVSSRGPVAAPRGFNGGTEGCGRPGDGTRRPAVPTAAPEGGVVVPGTGRGARACAARQRRRSGEALPCDARMACGFIRSSQHDGVFVLIGGFDGWDGLEGWELGRGRRWVWWCVVGWRFALREGVSAGRSRRGLGFLIGRCGGFGMRMRWCVGVGGVRGFGFRMWSGCRSRCGVRRVESVRGIAGGSGVRRRRCGVSWRVTGAGSAIERSGRRRGRGSGRGGRSRARWRGRPRCGAEVRAWLRRGGRQSNRGDAQARVTPMIGGCRSVMNRSTARCMQSRGELRRELTDLLRTRRWDAQDAGSDRVTRPDGRDGPDR